MLWVLLILINIYESYMNFEVGHKTQVKNCFFSNLNPNLTEFEFEH